MCCTLNLEAYYFSKQYNFTFFGFLCLEYHRRVYALNVVGEIPEELWTLTSLNNLYAFFLINFVRISSAHALLLLPEEAQTLIHVGSHFVP